jgi:hypothetical protein
LVGDWQVGALFLSPDSHSHRHWNMYAEGAHCCSITNAAGPSSPDSCRLLKGASHTHRRSSIKHSSVVHEGQSKMPNSIKQMF